MKFRCIVYALLLFVSTMNAQNQELDKRNGFKSLKLGASIEEFDNYKIINKTDSQTTIMWAPPSNSDLNYLFDNKIDVLSLSFNQDKQLKKILLTVIIEGKYGSNIAEREYNSIKGKITSVLGKSKTHPTNKFLSLWKGEDVDMGLFLKFEDSKLNDNDEFLTMHSIDLMILSSKVSVEENASGF